jgi:hypothetical protein
MGFEPKISASALPKAHALDRAAIGIGYEMLNCDIILEEMNFRRRSLL